MRVPLGSKAYLKRTENRDVPVVWDSRTAINPHVLVMGASWGWQDLESAADDPIHGPNFRWPGEDTCVGWTWAY
jgi:hypothetical protein